MLNYPGLSEADIESVARSSSLPLSALGGIHVVEAKDIGNEIADQEEACWLCDALKILLPEVPTEALMAALADDSTAFALAEQELLAIRDKLLEKFSDS